MLDLNKSQLIETRVENLSASVVNVDEGTPMVHVLEGGRAACKPATGAAKEVFVGVAVGRSTTPTVVPYYERLTVPASGTYKVTLSKTLNGSVGVVALVNSDGSITPLTAGSASNANEYSISGQEITVNSAQAGKTLQVNYRYSISMAEAMLRYSFNAFAPAAINIGTQGLIATGEVFVDNFDPTSNWAGFTNVTDTPIKLGNGVFTLSGSGSAITAVVTSVPGVDSPYLGIRLNPGY